MSNEEVTYSTLRFLRAPSKVQNGLRSNATKRPRKANDKGRSVPWHLTAATLGIICLLLLATVAGLVAKIFQEKNEKEKIPENLRQASNITQNDTSSKEFLTNKTLDISILKNKTHQQKTEPESSSNKRCHRKNKTLLKHLQNTGKICDVHLACCGVKCYYFILDYQSWGKCKMTCQNYGLSLLKIDDKDELDFLQFLVGGNAYWIGLSYDAGEGRWKWLGGAGLNVTMTYLPSRDGQCAFLSAVRISNIDCAKEYSCICEKRMDSTFPASAVSKGAEKLDRYGNRER